MAKEPRSELAELLDGNEALVRAFEGINQPITLVDTNLVIVFCNEKYFQETGYKRKEVIGTRLGRVIVDDEPQRLLFDHVKAALKGKRSRFRVPGRLKDGSEVWAEISLGPFVSESGKVVGVIGASANVSNTVAAQKKLEKTVRLTEGELEGAVAKLQGEVKARKVAERIALAQKKVLCDILDALVANPDLDAFFEILLRSVNETLRAPSSGLWLRVDDTDRAQLYTTFPDLGEAAKSKSYADIRLDPPAAESMFHLKKPYVVDVPFRMETLPLAVQSMYQKLGIKATLTVPILRAHEAIGFISVRRKTKHTFTASEIELSVALADLAALALELRDLAAKSKENAVLEERNRLAREIHDTLAQSFAGIQLHARAADRSLREGRQEPTEEHIGQIQGLAREGLAEARRSVYALKPAALQSRNLAEAISALAKRAMVDGNKVRFTVTGVTFPLQSEAESALLRIAQEALGNAIRHSGASQITVALKFAKPDVLLTIKDNGKGFDGEMVKGRGYGLESMRDRAAALGMEFAVISRSTGTAITVGGRKVAAG